MRLVVAVVLAGAFALILFAHGVRWWYAPLAVVGVLLAHIALLGGIVFVTARVTQPARHSQQGGSMLLHKPRQFDLLVRVLTLGRERKLRQWTLDLADLREGNSILDVGSGTGTLLLAAAERVGPSGVMHGIEPSPEMAAQARRKAQTRRVPLKVVDGSADGLPYPPASFDAVFCTLVFHHLPRSMQESAIREMRRVLRPGGRLVIVDWQEPKSFARAITSPMFLVYLIHNLGPRRAPLDAPGIEAQMRSSGFEDIARCSFGAGGAVGAVVGRLAPGTRVIVGPNRETSPASAPMLDGVRTGHGTPQARRG